MRLCWKGTGYGGAHLQSQHLRVREGGAGLYTELQAMMRPSLKKKKKYYILIYNLYSVAII